ncbi:hypothetical protein D3C79_880750 [compost metagenome]
MNRACNCRVRRISVFQAPEYCLRQLRKHCIQRFFKAHDVNEPDALTRDCKADDGYREFAGRGEPYWMIPTGWDQQTGFAMQADCVTYDTEASVDAGVQSRNLDDAIAPLTGAKLRPPMKRIMHRQSAPLPLQRALPMLRRSFLPMEHPAPPRSTHQRDP